MLSWASWHWRHLRRSPAQEAVCLVCTGARKQYVTVHIYVLRDARVFTDNCTAEAACDVDVVCV